MKCLRFLVLFAIFISVFAKPLLTTSPNQRFQRAIIAPLKDEKGNKIPLVEPPPLPTVTETDIALLKNLNILPASITPSSSIESNPKMLDTPIPTTLVNKIDAKEVLKEVVKEAVKEIVIENISVISNPPTLPTIDLIKTCTPDCTLPHCTEACKCANTHADAQAKCNPPPNAPITELCHIWYAKCPMFKPLMFDATGPLPFVIRRRRA